MQKRSTPKLTNSDLMQIFEYQHSRTNFYHVITYYSIRNIENTYRNGRRQTQNNKLKSFRREIEETKERKIKEYIINCQYNK